MILGIVILLLKGLLLVMLFVSGLIVLLLFMALLMGMGQRSGGTIAPRSPRLPRAE